MAKTATLRQMGDLLAANLIQADEAAALGPVAERYAVAVTPHIANLIGTDLEGPIARQYLPAPKELLTTPEERPDPIGDLAHQPVKGIVHRYPDRVLLKPTHACAVYCRFCFRREMVGPGGEALDAAETALALDYIRSAPMVREVILTGGEPLLLAPRRLHDIMKALGAIAHLRVVRIHTRLPVADPARITPDLLAAIKASGKPLWLALHCNHPRELEAPEVRQALGDMAAAGVHLLGQSVLLRDVNDNADVLAELFWRMIELGIKPTYLHHPDLAPGTSHFRLPVAEGQTLMQTLRGRMPGYAIPTYILDIPGGFGKVPIGPVYYDPEHGLVTDIKGNRHEYEPASAPES